MNKKLLWILWHPTPYNTHLLNEASKSYEVVVIYIADILSTHPWSASFEQHFKKLAWKKSDSKRKIISEVCSSSYRLRIVGGWNHPLMIFALVSFAVLQRSFVIWTDTPRLLKKRGFTKRAFHWFLQFIIKRATAIFATGAIGASNFKRIYGQQLNVLNFPWTTDLNFYSPRISPVKEVPLAVLSIGRLLNVHKGFDVAVQSIKDLKDQHRHSDFHYYIIGEGPDREKLTRMIAEFGLERQITIVGWLDPVEIIKHYKACSVFIHPSHVDPYPNAVLEAMACGLPVISSNAAGSAVDRIINGYNGLLFEDGRSDQLTDHLAELLNSPEKRIALGREARKTAELWPVDFNLQQLNDLLRDK
ncbi:MAG: glycosyltransferase [Flammeovirgaceae bacterium]|jgi:glycosyltransferase involved in cell wall biosynthesis|nr:glycosyltransferase [Flammeovirgaceae bacterium]